MASHVHEPDAHVTPYTTPTSAFAVVSLIFGLGVFFTLGFTGLPAVILGHVAHGETVTGERGGHGMTVAGLFFGYLAIAAWVFALVFFTWVARDTQIPHIQIPNINNQN